MFPRDFPYKIHFLKKAQVFEQKQTVTTRNNTEDYSYHHTNRPKTEGVIKGMYHIETTDDRNNETKHRNKTGILSKSNDSILPPSFIIVYLRKGAIMNLFQKQPTTSGYNRIPNAIAADDDETAAVSVPLGTNLLSPSPTTMTRGRRSSKGRRIALVAAVIMLVMMVAGGTVWRRDGGLSSNSSSGSLETEDGGLTTTWGPPGSCVPATGQWTAGRVSTTA